MILLDLVTNELLQSFNSVINASIFISNTQNIKSSTVYKKLLANIDKNKIIVLFNYKWKIL